MFNAVPMTSLFTILRFHNMPLEFIKSQKGKPLLRHNGHLFNFDNRLSTSNRARKCVKYANFRCPSRIHTDAADLEIIREIGDHNHAADAANVGARIIVNSLRMRAIDTQEAPNQLIATVTAGKIPDI